MMKKLLKTFFKILLGLILTLALLISVSIFYLNLQKETLWLSTSTKLNSTLKSDVKISSISVGFGNSFSNLKLLIKDFSITDSLSKKEIAVFERFEAYFDLVSLLKLSPQIESITLKGGKFEIIKYPDGSVNFSVLNQSKPQKSDTTSQKVASLRNLLFFKKITLQNSSFELKDSVEEKHIQLEAKNLVITKNEQDTTSTLFINGLVNVGGLGFNLDKGYFLKDKSVELKTSMLFYEKYPKIEFLPGVATIDSSTYNVKGYIIPDKFPELNLVISTEEALTRKVFPCLSEHIQKKLNPFLVQNTLIASITIGGILLPSTDPQIDLIFYTTDNNFQYNGIPITVTNMAFAGKFCNHVNNSIVQGDPNSEIEVKNIKGTIGYGNLSAFLKISDFINPTISTTANVELNFKDLNNKIPDFPITDAQGKALINVSYKGKMPADNTFSHVARWRYDGEVNIDSVSFSLSGIRYTGIHGKVKIKNDTIKISNNFNFSIAENQVDIKGEIYRPLRHFLTKDTSTYANVYVHSPYFDINKILTHNQNKKSNSHSQTPISAKNIRKKLNDVYVKLTLDFEKAKFKKLLANNLKGEILRNNQEVTLKNIVVKGAGGILKVSGTMKESKQTNGTVKIENVDVKKLFYGLNNFGQKTISDQNLEGKFSANIDFSASLDDKYNPVLGSMDGTLDFKLTNGKLLKFEPIANLSKFIFKKRELDNISFSEIKQKAMLKKGTLHISSMQIQSTALSLSLEGEYDFNNQVNLKFHLPWYNFKSKEKYLAAVENSTGTEKGLNFKAYTQNGKLNFALGH